MYFKFTRQDMTLPDSVMAFMLLASCSLSEAERQLVMSAITDVTYDKMKSALKRIFCGDITQKGISSSSAIEIKSEPVFYAKENYDRDDDAAAVMYSRGSFRGKSSWRGRRNTRGTPATGANRQPVDRVGRKQNPVGPDGKTSRCLVCDSRFHWARQCPDAYENNKRKGESYRSNDDLDDDKEDMVHLSLFVGYTNESRSYKLDKLVSESENCAVLDTGCSNTVCGVEWLDEYMKGLSDYDKSKVIEATSSSTFTFGDGVKVYSKKKVTLPCKFGNINVSLTTDVVDCKIPLLMSKFSMKKACMLLDFKSDTVTIGKTTIKLLSSTSGHYLLPISL